MASWKKKNLLSFPWNYAGFHQKRAWPPARVSERSSHHLWLWKPQLVGLLASSASAQFGHVGCFSNRERGVTPGFTRLYTSQEMGYNLEILPKQCKDCGIEDEKKEGSKGLRRVRDFIWPRQDSIHRFVSFLAGKLWIFPILLSITTLSGAFHLFWNSGNTKVSLRAHSSGLSLAPSDFPYGCARRPGLPYF